MNEMNMKEISDIIEIKEIREMREIWYMGKRGKLLLWDPRFIELTLNTPVIKMKKKIFTRLRNIFKEIDIMMSVLLGSIDIEY